MAQVKRREWTNKDGTTGSAWLVDYRDRNGKRHFQQFELKRHAVARLIEIQGELQRGIHTAISDSISVAEAADRWIERRRVLGRERSTLAQYRLHADRHIIPALGSTKLGKLTAPMVDQFYAELLGRCSASTARKVLRSLKQLLTSAQRSGLVAQNVALAIKDDESNRDKRMLVVGRDIPSKAEVQKIITTAEGRWRPLFVTAIFTGMRASELRGLTWSAVDFDKRVVHVRQRANLWNEIGRPKSKAGEREIPLSPMVVNVLREWKLACPRGELELVFPNRSGSVEHHGIIANRGFGEVQRKASIIDDQGKPRYSMHSLRHFAASFFIDQQFSIKRVQSLLGHASASMTLDVYGHLFPSLEDDHAKLAAGELALIGAS